MKESKFEEFIIAITIFIIGFLVGCGTISTRQEYLMNKNIANVEEI